MSVVTLDTTFTAFFIPISAIVQWPTPNYVNPETRYWIVPYAIALGLLSTVSLVGRAYSKRQLKQLGIDDILIFFAWVFGNLFTVSLIYGVTKGGYDRHIWDVPPAVSVSGGFVGWLSEAVFFLSSTMTKLSILIFQRRLISRTVNRRIRQAINAAIVFTVVYSITFLVFLALACTPMDATWKSLDTSYQKPYKCVHRNVVDPLVGALSVFSDVYALVIPEIVISGLRIRKCQKVTLYAVFGSGLIVAGAGLARTVWLARMYTDSKRDITWIVYEILAWTQLEMQLAIVCASAPALKSLFSNAKRGTSRPGVATYGEATGGAMKSSEEVQRDRSTETSSIEESKAFAQKGILVTETLSIQSTWHQEAPTSQQFHKGRRILGLSD